LRTSLPPALSVIKPGNISDALAPDQHSTSNILHYAGTELPGVYSVQTNTELLDKFAVNIDPDESKTERADEKRQQAVFSRCGFGGGQIHEISQSRDVQRMIAESRLGAELWKQFLIAALCVAILEMFIARENKSSALAPTHSSE